MEGNRERRQGRRIEKMRALLHLSGGNRACNGRVLKRGSETGARIPIVVQRLVGTARWRQRPAVFCRGSIDCARSET